jgi:hypothetical protein
MITLSTPPSSNQPTSMWRVLDVCFVFLLLSIPLPTHEIPAWNNWAHGRRCMKLDYIGPYFLFFFFIQTVRAGAALGGVFIGVQ